MELLILIIVLIIILAASLKKINLARISERDARAIMEMIKVVKKKDM